MNLIEQLGGYEKAKAFLNATSFTIDELVMMQRSGVRPQHVKKALLEYRRQHNIFEKGDWVVNIKTGAFGDFIKYADTNKGHKHCFVDIGLCDVALFCVKNTRHATDEEIKAGTRLEVK